MFMIKAQIVVNQLNVWILNASDILQKTTSDWHCDIVQVISIFFIPACILKLVEKRYNHSYSIVHMYHNGNMFFNLL